MSSTIPIAIEPSESDRRERQASPAWSVTLDVLYLARDLFDVIETSALDQEKRIQALEAALLWAQPGPKGMDLVFPKYAVSRELLQRLEKNP